jgi:hypothetical protein
MAAMIDLSSPQHWQYVGYVDSRGERFFGCVQVVAYPVVYNYYTPSGILAQ